MRCFRKRSLCSFALALFGVLALLPLQAAEPDSFTVPITYYKLPNGLRVILSPDPTAPTVVTAVYYRIGFRVEPKDRTGFAHLFEHMMFQGSAESGQDGIHPPGAGERRRAERVHALRFH